MCLKSYPVRKSSKLHVLVSTLKSTKHLHQYIPFHRSLRAPQRLNKQHDGLFAPCSAVRPCLDCRLIEHVDLRTLMSLALTVDAAAERCEKVWDPCHRKRADIVVDCLTGKAPLGMQAVNGSMWVQSSLIAYSQASADSTMTTCTLAGERSCLYSK